MLTFKIKSIKDSDLYNPLYKNSCTNGIQEKDMYSNSRHTPVPNKLSDL